MTVFYFVTMDIPIAAFLSEHFRQNNPSLCALVVLGPRVSKSNPSYLAHNGFIPFRVNTMFCADKPQMQKEMKKEGRMPGALLSLGSVPL